MSHSGESEGEGYSTRNLTTHRSAFGSKKLRYYTSSVRTPSLLVRIPIPCMHSMVIPYVVDAALPIHIYIYKHTHTLLAYPAPTGVVTQCVACPLLGALPPEGSPAAPVRAAVGLGHPPQGSFDVEPAAAPRRLVAGLALHLVAHAPSLLPPLGGFLGLGKVANLFFRPNGIIIPEFWDCQRQQRLRTVMPYFYNPNPK